MRTYLYTTSMAHGRSLATILAAGLLIGTAACSDDPTEVVRDEPPPPNDLPASNLSRADLRAEGRVTQNSDGFTVAGTLHVSRGAQQTTFANADVRVRFDAANRVTSMSGKVQIPSPHERVTFADPVRADVGLFKGKFLNEQRDLGIKLKDDTDYFVYDVATSFEMRVATGETGAQATRPLAVRVPIGGRILMVVDYTDPMYYVYGANDLLGAAGIGWSHNGRIPFTPKYPVQGLGTFDGKNTRTGTFPVFKILSVTGQMVDNEYTEVHLSLQDPFSSNLRKGYQAGYNGDMALDLFLKDIVGLEIPIAGGSGGVWAEASMQNIFRGHAYASGKTSRDASWWPAFIPARPIIGLDVQAMLKSNGDFKVGLAGEYGWQLPTGTHAMRGSFELTPNAMTLTGAIQDGAVALSITGKVTKAATTVFVVPPRQLLDAVSTQVNSELGPRIANAQRAYDNLKKATSDYQIELSLRGLRTAIPAVVDVAKQALTNGINSELSKHSGTVYYGTLSSTLWNEAAPYYRALDNLKAAALDMRDNAQTRQAIEATLRAVAANKIFRATFTYKVLGVTVASVYVEKRIMSDAQAAQILNAANNVRYIKETSDIKIRMQQIYDQIPDRQIFEQVRDDVQNGVIKMAAISELGMVYAHAPKTIAVYAVIGGTRHELGSINAFSVAALAAALPGVMIEALKTN
ncbi:MAG: hypothetical protein ACRENP_04025 [Longimicrobiales bacterium]